MKYYKDENNKVFAYEDHVPEFGHYNEVETTDENGEIVLEKVYPDFSVKEGVISIAKEEVEELSKPKLSQEDIINNNELVKSQLINEANQKIAILQDAIDLDMQESNKEEQLKAWKKYRIFLTETVHNSVSA